MPRWVGAAQRRLRSVPPVEGRFAAATAVAPAAADRYAAEVHDGWDIGGNANGGYLLAIAGRAMAAAAQRPPLTITAHYLRPAPPGPVEIGVRIVRTGRRLATVAATMFQGGTAILELLGTFGEQQPGGPSLRQGAPPELPPFDRCRPRPATAEAPALVAQLDVRLHPDDAGFVSGEPSGAAVVRGWFALADEEPIDACALLLAADAFPPPVFNTDLPVGWVPTIELTVHVRGVPAPGPLRCGFRSRFVDDGLVDEDGELWDSAGHLVAQCRQLALTPRPPG